MGLFIFELLNISGSFLLPIDRSHFFIFFAQTLFTQNQENLKLTFQFFANQLSQSHARFHFYSVSKPSKDQDHTLYQSLRKNTTTYTPTPNSFITNSVTKLYKNINIYIYISFIKGYKVFRRSGKGEFIYYKWVRCWLVEVSVVSFLEVY